MAIHFACRQCGKALFAQEQYTGRAIQCPGCQSENIIPAPRGEVPLPPAGVAEKSAPELLDMENAPPQGQGGPPNSGQPQAVAPAASQPADQMIRCPMCAEIIKAAAKKCRFCGALLDESLKAEQARAIERQVLSGFVGEAERSAHTWRVLAMVATTITAGWLLMLIMGAWNKSPLTLAVFNLLLTAGLLWNTGHMRRGPASVFIAAGAAVLFCMPIDAILGLALVDETAMAQIKSQDPQQYASLTTEQVNAFFGVLFTFVGVVFSVPIWIAAVKVALFQRLRSAREKDR